MCSILVVGLSQRRLFYVMSYGCAEREPYIPCSLLCNTHTLGTDTEARASSSGSSQLTLSAVHSASVSSRSRGYVRLVLLELSVGLF